MECQRIEHDIKLIYAGVLSGDMKENYKAIEFKSLGEVLFELKNIDIDNKTLYITKEDYKLLSKIKDVRNWLVHSSYVDFMYEQGRNLEVYYKQTYEKLQLFNSQIKVLGNQLEKARLTILRDYKRI